MRRTGSRPVGLLLALALVLAGEGRAAPRDVEFYQSVDRTEVGLEDVFRLTIVTSNAPAGAEVRFPEMDDFEVLSRSQSTEMSYQMLGGGPGVIKRIQKYVLVLRANRLGALSIPPSTLSAGGRTYRTDPIQMTVRKGRARDPNAGQAQRPDINDPFQNFPPGFRPGTPPGSSPFDEDEDEEMGIPDLDIPRSNSDLFLRASVDREEVYQGEQVTLSLYIFSRVDLSEVSALTMPKLDGFWSEDIDSPTQLSGERKLLNGIPYRSYLLKRRALFPVRSGTIEIGPVEVDVVTGFLFAGRRVHRKGNTLSIQVKPLPAQGKPPGFAVGNVGLWRLTTEASQTEVELGQPVTVKVILEGRGNLKNVTLPALTGSASLRIYDPTTTDKLAGGRAKIGGRRVQEYLVMPQQTGTLTLPGLAFPYFDPETERYEVSRTDPITLTVMPGAGAPPRGGSPDTVAKSVLTQGSALRPLRYQPTFSTPGEPIWRKGFFLPVLLAPLALHLALVLAGLVRGALSREDPGARKRKQTRAARKRLSGAERLKAEGSPHQFYGEIEKALLHFLEAKLGAPVGGLTRDVLLDRMRAAGVPEERQRRVLRVMDQCDTGRFAPGAADATRAQVLEEAAEVMEGWG